MKHEFAIGQHVYFAASSEQKGIVTGILIRNDTITYLVTWCDLNERYHNAIELTTEKPISI